MSTPASGLGPQYLRVETGLGRPLAAWLREQRADGMGWDWIAIEVSRITREVVTAATVRQWFAQTAHSVTYQVDPFKLCR